MWDLQFYFLIGLLVFAGFTVRAVTGFGSTMLIAPILALLFLEPKQVVVFVILLESAIGVIFIIKERLNFEVKPIFIGGIAGILAGILLFGWLSQMLC